MPPKTSRQKAVELERVSTYKSEFLANMSHELRTPLNSLMILSSLLMQNKEGNLTEKQVEFATTMNAAGSDLLDLINDILDLSKVEAGQMQFHSADIAVQDLCGSLRSLFEPQAEQKGLAFSARTEGNVPGAFRGDEQRVHQILKNLIANAIKFTDRGSVDLRVFTPSDRENPLPVEAIAFAISDTGIGIAPEKQDAVFQAFQQADGSISRRYGGTGLGLSISQQLAQRMNGDLRLASTVGSGSVFTLYLPVGATAEATSEKHPAPPRPATRPPMTHEAAAENVVPFRAPASRGAAGARGGRKKHLADRGRHQVLGHPGRHGARARLRSAFGRRRRVRPRTCRAPPSQCDHPRRDASESRRLGCDAAAEGQPAHASHPGAFHYLPRRKTEGDGDGRDRLRDETGGHQTTERGVRGDRRQRGEIGAQTPDRGG